MFGTSPDNPEHVFSETCKCLERFKRLRRFVLQTLSIKVQSSTQLCKTISDFAYCFENLAELVLKLTIDQYIDSTDFAYLERIKSLKHMDKTSIEFKYGATLVQVFHYVSE